jgi:hypothetical protein
MKKSTTNTKSALPPAVAEQYQVREGLLSKFVCNEFGEVDLGIITLEFAERLAAAGYLKKLSSEET